MLTATQEITPEAREHAGHWRQVADVTVDDAEQRDDRGLVRGDRIEICTFGTL
jgi:hypothetical protein